MVAVKHSLPEDGSAGVGSFDLAATGLDTDSRAKQLDAWDWTISCYGDRKLSSGEAVLPHVQGTAIILAALNPDLDTRIAALLFDIGKDIADAREQLHRRYGITVVELVQGLERLAPLRLLTRSSGAEQQTEILRKMMLAMVADIRVVLIRLASRTQTLRWLVDSGSAEKKEFARESLEIYAPLANRLGVWQFKWEIEDLSLRLLEPATYKRIARMLDQRRVEREQFIADATLRLKHQLAEAGIDGDVIGRPKHIYSIWNKMRAKSLDFDEVHDVRAVRVMVAEVRDCYAVLGIVHHLWSPIEGEFDDYIAQPKGNQYRSLHTAVVVEDGGSLEVQIRTREMNEHAELGVAAHWRYKEIGAPTIADTSYDNKIALLRQLVSWRDEVTDSSAWVDQFKRAALDDTIYVLTPQGRVIDLPHGATALDFAYRLHTDLGHRCRGARADGQMWPLNKPLKNGQTIEIVAAKEGGPSRDWLRATQKYLATQGARRKVRQWFATHESAETLARGRQFVTHELQRDGQSQANLEALATRLGFRNVDAMFIAAGHSELGPRQIQLALHDDAPAIESAPVVATKRSRASNSQVLVVGVDKLLTQLGRCCKPAPPDAILGFVTRGRGVSIHRNECINFRHLARRNPERVIAAAWGGSAEVADAVYAIDIQIEAQDRQGLLRDISETLSREKVNVTAAKTTSRKDGTARMNFTIEITAAVPLQHVLRVLSSVTSVYRAQRV